MRDIDFYIGIDPGKNTGIAVWNTEDKKFILIDTLSIHIAIDLVSKLNSEYKIFVRIEDARKRKWFGKSGREQLQGAGSIKRDCVIWEDFLKDKKIEHELLSPMQKGKKISKEYFNQLTKYNKNTSQHSRDAAMLVFGL